MSVYNKCSYKHFLSELDRLLYMKNMVRNDVANIIGADRATAMHVLHMMETGVRVSTSYLEKTADYFGKMLCYKDGEYYMVTGEIKGK